MINADSATPFWRMSTIWCAIIVQDLFQRRVLLPNLQGHVQKFIDKQLTLIKTKY